jgi:16S rRNA (cytosine1402-N4)-methyltransferase
MSEEEAAVDHQKDQRHIPVLCEEVLRLLQPKNNEIFIDGTFGAGGHTLGLLKSCDCRVLALDRDPTAIECAEELASKFTSRLSLSHRSFSQLQCAALEFGLKSVDGVLLDVGLSSMQIDNSNRGFSFQHDGPLDMRMSCVGPTASDVVNTFDEDQLADIFLSLGEVRHARKIAREIMRQRVKKPFTRTKELADLIIRVMGGRRWGEIHPATQAFQALRIYVNDELTELKKGLQAAEAILKPEGRLVVITFHSLEDRIVKHFLRERSGKADHGSRYKPSPRRTFSAPSFRIINSRPLTPNESEINVNPRARSARLRAAQRTEAPIWKEREETF